MTTDELIRRTFPAVIALYEASDPVVTKIASEIEDAMRDANNDLCAEIYDRETH